MAPKLLDNVRETIRLKHLSHRTEESYVQWIKRFVLFHNKRHPLEMGENEIRQFLAYLAQRKYVSSSTQNQALNPEIIQVDFVSIFPMYSVPSKRDPFGSFGKATTSWLPLSLRPKKVANSKY
jgi:hypothetical protein